MTCEPCVEGKLGTVAIGIEMGIVGIDVVEEAGSVIL